MAICIKPIGSRRPLLCCCPGRRYHAQTSIHYRACIFRLKQHDLLTWEGLRLGSGFEVELTYAKSVVVDGSVIGLNDDFDLTPSLARFLTLNEELIPNRLARFEVILDSYQNFYRLECRAKAETLSYQFLAFVYNTPCGPAEVAEYCAKAEQDERVQRLVLASERIFRVSYERLLVASATELNTWWYLFWVISAFSLSGYYLLVCLRMTCGDETTRQSADYRNMRQISTRITPPL